MGKPKVINPKDIIEFDYVNYKGNKSHRKVMIHSICFGATEYHTEDQWLIQGYDMNKEVHRTFAMRDMTNVVYKPW